MSWIGLGLVGRRGARQERHAGGAAAARGESGGALRAERAAAAGGGRALKGPLYSGFGVYSKSSMSSDTTSRLITRYPWPSSM